MVVLDEELLICIELGYDFFYMVVFVVVFLFLMGVIYIRILISLCRYSNIIYSELFGCLVLCVNVGRWKVNEKKIVLLFIVMIIVFICGLFFYFFWVFMEDLEVVGFYSILLKVMNMIVMSIIFFCFFIVLCNFFLCMFMK